MAGTVAAPALCLEDLVFGLDSRAAIPDPDRPPPLSSGGPSPTNKGADPVTSFMLPMVAACILVGVSLWSISRSVRYHEIFVVNPRYQYGLYAMNAVVVFVTMVVLCQRRPRRP